MVAIPHFGGAHRPAPERLPLRRPNGWLLAAAAVAATGALLPVLQNSLATSRGFDIQSADSRRVVLEGEISLMEADVARLASLNRIQRRALELGLGPASDPIFVTVAEPGPAPAKVPAEFLPRPERDLAEPEPWWRSLVSWLPFLP
jgi:hypothetical protein